MLRLFGIRPYIQDRSLTLTNLEITRDKQPVVIGSAK